MSTALLTNLTYIIMFIMITDCTFIKLINRFIPRDSYTTFSATRQVISPPTLNLNGFCVHRNNLLKIGRNFIIFSDNSILAANILLF